MMSKKIVTSFLILSLVILLVGCGSDEEKDKDEEQPTLTDMTPVEATVTVSGDVTSSTKPDDWVYFSFKTGATVPPVQKNTTNWDIRFLGTKMSTNSGTTAIEVGSNGKGGAMIVKESDLMKVTQAPTDGYIVDVICTIAAMSTPKPTASINQLLTKEDEKDPNYDNNHWYTGSGANLSADGTKCYIIRCADGKSYARVQFTNYVKSGDSRTFTFSYNYTDRVDRRFVK